MLGYSLGMGDVLARNTAGATPWNVTAKMRGWKDSIQDIGGYWQGGGKFWMGADDPLVSKIEAVELFTSGLGNHIARSQDGRTCWDGRISALELTLDGLTLRRSLDNLANSIKIVYSKWGANQVVNGSAESALVDLTNYYHVVTGGGPMTITQSSVWSSLGSYSFLVTDTAAPGAGWYGGFGVYAGTAAANSKYRFSATCYCPVSDASGTVAADVFVAGGTSIVHSTIVPINGSGTYSVTVDFTTSPTQSGAVTIEFTSDYVTDVGQNWRWHVDGVVLQEFGSRAETGWLGNSDSIAVYGPKEDIKLMDSITDAEAIARQAQLLERHSWPRSFPVGISGSGDDGLTLEAQGYIFVQAGKSVSLGGVAAASTHLATLLAVASPVSAGYIATNALSVYVDEVNPIRLWDGLEKVVKAGGVGGVRYVGGVGPGRLFNYQARDTTARYRRKGNAWLYMDGALADPQTMQPAIVYLEDVPTGGLPPGSTSLEDDSRYAYVPAWEYDADSNSVSPIEIKDLDDWQS